MVKNLSDSWISTRGQVGFGQFWLLPHPCSGLHPSLFGIVMGRAPTKTMLCKRGVLGLFFYGNENGGNCCQWITHEQGQGWGCSSITNFLGKNTYVKIMKTSA